MPQSTQSGILHWGTAIAAVTLSVFMTNPVLARPTTTMPPLFEKNAIIGANALPLPAGTMPKSDRGEMKLAEGRCRWIEIINPGPILCTKVIEALTHKLIEKCTKGPDKKERKQVCDDMPPPPHFPKPGVQQ